MAWLFQQAELDAAECSLRRPADARNLRPCRSGGGRLAILAIVLLVRGVGTDRSSHAEAIFTERVTRGEIDEDEYRRRLDLIRSRR